MPINLTGSTIASTYDQLLHVDDGPTASQKTVYSGTGVATALKLGTTSLGVGNLSLTGNTLSSTDTNGNIVLAPNGTGSVSATKVAITGGSITGITDLAIADGGTGASTASDARTNLGLGSIATQAANNVSITGGSISGVSFSGAFTGITSIESAAYYTSDATNGLTISGRDIYADGSATNIDINITPKGTGRTVVGNLSTTQISDTNNNELVKFTTTASAVNEVTIQNAATAGSPTIAATGDDTNINLDIFPKGTGRTFVTNLTTTSPRIITGIDDSSGNELIKVTATASAVNEITLANAATAGSPTIAATGDDTNVGLNISSKGSGDVSVTGKFGYRTGMGGTVTQATSKSTGVTLDKVCGQITMDAAQLNRVTSVTFTLTNSYIAATDVVVVNIASGATAGAYTITVEVVAAGSCNISLHNLLTGTDLSEAVVLNFAVIKAVNA